MLKTGDQLYNPSSKTTFTFLKTAQDTKGEYLSISCVIEANNKLSGFTHSHPKQTEIINVVSGSLAVVINGKSMVYNPGEMLVIKPGDSHHWWNASNKQALSLTMEIRPALQTERLIQTICALAKESQSERNDGLNLLQLAVIMKDFKHLYVIAGPAAFIKKAAFKVLAVIGRYKGYTSNAAIKSFFSGSVPTNQM